MNRFQIGDKVVALKAHESISSQPRIKGNVYTVKDIMYCGRCGHQNINLGWPKPPHISNNVTCGECRGSSPNRGLEWTNSKYFAKLDDLDAALQEAVENEDYETASLLRDLMRSKIEI